MSGASNYPPGVTGHEPQIAGPSAEFEDWLDQVDQIVTTKTGLSFYDLPDVISSYDAYDDGDTPQTFANAALDEAGYTD